MNVGYGEGKTEYGPGVRIDLTGDEVAVAIETWLVAHGVHISGPRTTSVNDLLCGSGRVYVDPLGFVVHDEKVFSGRGERGEYARSPS
jgi:hypothetical protein